MSTVTGAVNRVLIGVVGLVLSATGVAVLAAGAGLGVPSWWPWNGPEDVLLSRSERKRWQGEDWWWPLVITVLTVVVLLALCWLIAQLRRSRLPGILVDSGDGDGATLRGRALESVLAGEAEHVAGVSRAQVVLHGRRTVPTLRVRLLLEPYASPGEVLDRVSAGAFRNARESVGLSVFPAEVRLRAVTYHAQRVT
ncbi:alkaline shock response membrane anchor protein AmaP [Streptomyces sp. NPDC059176]|uniref:alkaline shock response membrane anchor protein AmaP n=1 Tax=Streptomyces sp. NPDC059176 TaxID=3346758 RepID=UPI00369E7904